MNRSIASILIALAMAAGSADAQLRVGRAAVKITPPIGAVIGNSYGIGVSTGVHDDLYAKAIVLEVGGARTALVACDLISIRRPIVERTRRLIAQSTSLRGDRVILSATHCHAGPQMHPMFWSLVGGEPARLSEQYVAELPGKIAESVRLAEADLQPARVRASIAREDSLTFNRRYLLQDGTVVMNPGRLNSNIVRAMGPIDPDLAIVYFDTPDGKPLATYVNFALHVAIVGGREFSADYPGVLARALAEAKGAGMLTLFTNGMSGNINQVDVKRADQLGGQGEAERIGAALAAGVLNAHAQTQPVEPARLDVRTEKVALDTLAFRPEEARWARETIARYGKPGAPPFLDVVHAWKVLDVGALDGKPLETEVQVVALGDRLAWVGMPGDAFVELGLAVKRGSPFRYTIVSEQSGNGTLSYVPHREAFPEGSYEVISARFAPGGAEKLVEAVRRLLAQAKGGP